MPRPELSDPTPGRRRKQRGSVMMEGGLTLVVFVSFFLAAVDIAQLMMVHQSLTERARWAARRTAVSCCNVDVVKNRVRYGADTPGVNQVPMYGLTAAHVQVSMSGQNTPDQRLTITISGFTYKAFTPMLSGTFSGIPINVAIPLELP